MRDRNTIRERMRTNRQSRACSRLLHRGHVLLVAHLETCTGTPGWWLDPPIERAQPNVVASGVVAWASASVVEPYDRVAHSHRHDHNHPCHVTDPSVVACEVSPFEGSSSDSRASCPGAVVAASCLVVEDSTLSIIYSCSRETDKERASG